jgi:hypothetical protein
MSPVTWGVLDGSGWVWQTADAGAAFRLERELRKSGDGSARAVVSLDGVNWRTVAVSSVSRPDPAPPLRPTVTRLSGPGLPGGRSWWYRALSVGMRWVKSGALATFKANRRG